MTNSQPPHTNLGPGVLAEFYILLLVSLFTVVLRSYTRLRITKRWGWDDTTIIIAWIFHLIAVVFFSLMVKSGIGQHAMYLANPEKQLLEIIKWQVFFQTAIVLCTLITKISISLLILRIMDTRALRYILGVMMFIMTAATVAMIVTEFISCIPLYALWTPTIKGKCIAPSKVYDVAYVQSACTIVTDLCLTISPIVILWNLKISKRKKALVCFLMSLGLTATIANALRSAFEQTLLVSDPSYASTRVTIVCSLEMGFGIIAGCVPACMPFIKSLKAGDNQKRYSYVFEDRSGREQIKQGSKTSAENGAWVDSIDDEAGLIYLSPVHINSKSVAV